MKTSAFSKLLAVSALTLAPALAHAHSGPPGHVHSGFGDGLAHPIMGVDHLLAMIAVGLWASQLGRRALWQVPAAFVGLMALGGALGMSGVRVPLMEEGILASVLVLGVLVAAAVRLPAMAGAALVGAFAVFHGVAHGAEMTSSGSEVVYATGFHLATAALHAIGAAFGLLAGRIAQSQAVRFAGGAICLAGIVLAVS